MNEQFDWNKFFIKLTSRKFWAFLAVFVVAVYTMATTGASDVQITSLIIALGDVVCYIFGEAIVDRKREE